MDEVRIDKYLWAVRAFKTRSEAADACKGNRVKVNDSDAKPSKMIRVGDKREQGGGAAGSAVCREPDAAGGTGQAEGSGGDFLREA